MITSLLIITTELTVCILAIVLLVLVVVRHVAPRWNGMRLSGSIELFPVEARPPSAPTGCKLVAGDGGPERAKSL